MPRESGAAFSDADVRLPYRPGQVFCTGANYKKHVVGLIMGDPSMRTKEHEEVDPAELKARVEAMMDERRKLERELAEAKKKLALGGGDAAGASDAVREVAGVKYLGRVVTGVEPKDLKGLADEGKKSLGSGVVAFVGVSPDGKASAVVAVTDDLTTRLSAVDLVRVASAALGGKGGGGRPDMAQAGGPDGSRAAESIEAVATAIAG